MAINHALTAANNTTRVKVVSTGSDAIHVLVGDPAQTWPEGSYIEVVRNSATAAVEFHPFDGSVTLNKLTAGLFDLRDGEYGRVSLVSPGVWDLHVHRIPVDPLPPTPVPTDLKPRPMAQVTISTNTYNGFSALHHNTHFRSTSAADVTIAVQPDSFWTGGDSWDTNGGYPISPGPMPDGGSIIVGKHAVGNITFVAGPGVVINTPDTLILNKLNGKVTLMKVGANTWDLEGNLATV